MGQGQSNSDGAAQGYERRDWERQVKAFQRNTNGKMTIKDFKALQAQIAFEYPALASVHESMLITDNRLPDCPIVYANDQFERMTLYPKEAVLGVNCRFLQGPLTDKGVVRQIGDAVREGRALDVELLNYRKDGVPFWNIFLMLPVHKKGHKTGKPHFFLAVQKDVSVIKGLRRNVDAWSAPEVCMWLERNGLGHLASRFLEHKIEGHALRTLRTGDLRDIGVKLSADRRRVLAAVASDFDENDEYIHARESGARHVAAEVQVVTELQPEAEVNPLEYWGDGAIGVDAQRMTVKCTYGTRQPVVLLLAPSISVKELKQQLHERLGRKYSVKFMDDEGDVYPLRTEEDLETALAISDNHTLTLKLSKPSAPVKGSNASLLSCIPSAVMCVDAFGVVCFANDAALALVGVRDMMENGVEKYVTPIDGQWSTLHEIAGVGGSAELHHPDDTAERCSLQVTLCQPGLAVVTLSADGCTAQGTPLGPSNS